MPNYVDADADIRGKYRYSLMRKLATGEGTVLFVGLNPSTATAKEDDHTVRRCVRFAQAWGRERLYLGNLNAWRATDPKALPADAATAVGPCNREVLEQLVRRADLIIAAWGRHRLNSEAATLAEWLRSLPKIHCLRLNKTGTPTHPRCVPKTAVPIKLPHAS